MFSVSRQLSAVGRLLEAERSRLLLWLPVALMIGIGLYFALRSEPPFYAGLLALAAVAAALWAARRLRWLLLPLMLTALGFSAAQLRTFLVAAPLLQGEVHEAMVEGSIDEIIVGENGAKLVLSHPVIEGIAPEATPRRLRVSFRAVDPAWAIGDRLKLTASLYPLPQPILPGGYDFARHFYYERIGGNGFAIGQAETIAHAEPQGMAAWLMRLRHAIGEDMRANMPGPAGTIAAAMTVGETSPIPEDVKNALRDAGLAHMLAIAGLHLGLVTAFMFFSTRLLLSLYPPLCVRLPAKKIAACVTLLAALVYLLLAGAPVSARRSFIMVAFVMTAILFDRRGISLRTLAIAAALILLVFPEVMLGASFQLSFAATLAIISFYETFGRPHVAPGRWWSAPLHHLLGIVCTSLAATLATLPFTLYQFNRFATFAVLGNVVAIPIATLVIMPSIVLSLLLMPFGLQGLAYFPLRHGIEIMLAAAAYTSSLPMAAMQLPAPTPWGLLMATFGLLWLCLMRKRWRLLGVPAIMLGLATLLLNPPPDLLVSADGRQVMARLSDGKYALLKGTKRAFITQAWLRAEGGAEALPLKTADDAALLCTGAICTLSHNGRIARFARHSDALAEACALPSDVLIVWWRVDACAGAARILDRNALERFGAHAVYLSRDGVRVTRVYAEGEARPWRVWGFTERE